MNLERAQRNTHWNMTIRANPEHRQGNHIGKHKVALGSLMIPAAIQGKGTRATACDIPQHVSSLVLCRWTALPQTPCCPQAVFKVHAPLPLPSATRLKRGSSTAILTAESERRQLSSTMTGHPFLPPGLWGLHTVY